MVLQEGRAEQCLVVLFGLPGAGKSTLARQLAADACAAQGPTAAAVIEFDSFGCHSDEGFSPEAWKQSRHAALAALEDALGSSDRQAGSVRLVIADDTMHLRSMRHHCFALARRRGAAYLQVYLRCPPELAQGRNAGRPGGQRVPAETIARAADALEGFPSSSGGPSWEEGCTLTVDAGALPGTAGALWGRVWAAWGPPLPPPPDIEAEEAERRAARAATASSLAHQADLAMRRALSSALSGAGGLPPGALAAAAARLNEGRRQSLADLARQLQQGGEGQAAAAEELVQSAQAAFSRHCLQVLAASEEG